jgi:hypothetical protein
MGQKGGLYDVARVRDAKSYDTIRIQKQTDKRCGCVEIRD